MSFATLARHRIEDTNTAGVAGGSLALFAVVAALDAATGAQLSFSFFYVLPLAVVAWRFGRTTAVASSVLAALVWLSVDVMTGTGRAVAIPAWNALIRGAFFLTITGLLVSLRGALQRETEAAQIDPLTGLANRRAFAAAAVRELSRSQRLSEPVTFAMIDLDDLKVMNDRHGHAAGDEALSAVGRVLTSSIRLTDYAARLGGDEFGLLLVGLNPIPVLERIHTRIAGQTVAGRSLGCSIGVTTVVGGDFDAAIDEADMALYESKRGGKGRIGYSALSMSIPLG